MKGRRGLVFLLLAALMALSSLTAFAAPDKPEYTFYFVSHGGPGDPYWQSFINGVKEQAKQLNVKINYIYPQKQGDVNELIKQLNAAIAAKPAGIGVTIDNIEGFAAPLQEARRLGIPVIAFDTVPEKDVSSPDPSVPRICYVGEDAFSAGQEVGRGAIKSFNLQSGDLVVALNHEAGNTSLQLRYNGIDDVLSKKGIKTDELAVPGDDPAQSQAILQNYLIKNPKAKAVLTMGPSGYLPAAKVLESNKLVGKVGLAGWDLVPEALDYIRSGEMAFAANEQPYYIATVAVYLLYMNVKYGFLPPPVFNTGLGNTDKGNIERWSKLVKDGRG